MVNKDSYKQKIFLTKEILIVLNKIMDKETKQSEQRKIIWFGKRKTYILQTGSKLWGTHETMQ